METMQGLKRSHYCGQVTADTIGKTVTVAGWVQKNRDKGSLVFVDLRDREGIVQLVFDDATPAALREKAQSVRAEFVLMAKGTVRERASKNPDIPTGDVEIYVEDLRILNRAQTPPFEISDRIDVKEELRLKYRYLDLRRSEMQHALRTRHRIVKATRDYFDTQGFIEIETPALIKSTPEGARDYLVPSRVHPGEFYALPQSPQQYKQLLMLAGYDRYMQVVRCFRDEDLRADRQPEFTQIDLEMTFVDEEDIIAVNEGFIQHVFREVLGREIPAPFRRIPYPEAMARFGSDKPDTRFDMELVDLTGLLQETGFKVFSGAIQAGGSVRAINAKGAADALSRKEIDKLTDFVKTYRAKGLAYTRLSSGGESSSFEKFLTEQEVAALRTAINAEPGDLLLVVADASNTVVFDSLGALRCHLADRLDLIDPDRFDLLWVTEFPLFEIDPESGAIAAKHHPFTAPIPEDLDKMEQDPTAVRARAYDVILNGSELGGGSIRINDSALQERMFAALGLDEATVQERFGSLIEAFRYGAPPHGGIAYGLDRLVMLMLGKSSIRDVIAFPKVQNARDLMVNCPSPVDPASLAELHLSINSD